MDSHDVREIEQDALAIIEALTEGNNKSAMKAANRIVDACEAFERKAKRLKSEPEPAKSPQAALEDPEQALTERNAQDLLEKPGLEAESRTAGEFVVPFGKHKGATIRAVPNGYLCWLMGVRREGKTFQPVSTTGLDWIRGNQFETLSQVKKYLTWRCWACGSTDMRFRHAKLCTSCWHEG